MEKNAKLKIGLVLDTSLDPTDGVQQYVVCVGEWLSSQGHEVHYLVGETKDRQLPNLHSLAKNIGVRFNGNRTTIPLPTSRTKLLNFIAKQHFDVLHVQLPHSPFMAHRLILAANTNTAIVGTFHVAPYGVAARVGNKVLGHWLKSSIKRFDEMLSVSPAAADFALSTFNIKSEILPNVINYETFHAAIPIQKNSQKLNILFLGRLVERKGCQVLLEAVALLANDKSVSPFKVTICGKGHLEKALKKYVFQNNLVDIVEFKGYINEIDKPGYYAAADISVFPSVSGESFGIVLLEAMASGRSAVLAGDNPGYRSVMEPKPDLLFPTKNPPLLANKLKSYLNNSALRASTASWGKTYSAQYDINLIGPKIVTIYNQALRKRHSQ